MKFMGKKAKVGGDNHLAAQFHIVIVMCCVLSVYLQDIPFLKMFFGAVKVDSHTNEIRIMNAFFGGTLFFAYAWCARIRPHFHSMRMIQAALVAFVGVFLGALFHNALDWGNDRMLPVLVILISTILGMLRARRFNERRSKLGVAYPISVRQVEAVILPPGAKDGHRIDDVHVTEWAIRK